MKPLSKQQVELISHLAVKYNLKYDKVRSLLSLVGRFTAKKISEIKKAEDKLYDPDSALTIHLTQFGKFIPNKARMNKVRETVQKMKEKNDSKKDGSI